MRQTTHARFIIVTFIFQSPFLGMVRLWFNVRSSFSDDPLHTSAGFLSPLSLLTNLFSADFSPSPCERFQVLLESHEPGPVIPSPAGHLKTFDQIAFVFVARVE